MNGDFLALHRIHCNSQHNLDCIMLFFQTSQYFETSQMKQHISQKMREIHDIRLLFLNLLIELVTTFPLRFNLLVTNESFADSIYQTNHIYFFRESGLLLTLNLVGNGKMYQDPTLKTQFANPYTTVYNILTLIHLKFLKLLYKFYFSSLKNLNMNV